MPANPRATTRSTAPAVGLAAALLLAACGGSPTTTPGAGGTSPTPTASSAPAGGHGAGGTAAGSAPEHRGAAPGTASAAGSPSASAPANSSAGAAAHHNAQDVSFAQGMSVHHASALAMAKLAERQASSGEVKALAERIEAAQDPEILTMSGWLRSWNEQVPDLSDPTGHGGTGHDMPGMDAMGMDPGEMRELTAARGARFDRMFLDMMIRHHQDAVEMAEQEQDKGQFPAAQELARSIAESQTAEIKEMQQLLKQR